MIGLHLRGDGFVDTISKVFQTGDAAVNAEQADVFKALQQGMDGVQIAAAGFVKAHVQRIGAGGNAAAQHAPRGVK